MFVFECSICNGGEGYCSPGCAEEGRNRKAAELWQTPWGFADSVTPVGQGIHFASTPSHGGFFVPDALLHRIPQKRRDWAKRWSRSENWYEEDCCWAAVAQAFPELFTAEQIQHAGKVLEWIDTNRT